MGSEKKKSIVGGILLTILPLIIGFVVQVSVVVIYYIKIYVQIIMEGSASGGNMDVNALQTELMSGIQEGSTLQIISVIAIGITTVIFPVWYYLLVRKEPKPTYKNILTVKSIGCLIILGVLIQICLSGLLEVILPLFPRTFEKYMILMDTVIMGDSIILTTILTVVFAPIAEECMTRGLTMNGAKRYMPLWAANVVQAFIFGVYHGNIVQGVYAFFIGLLCGWIVIKSKSILPAILLHMTINGAALFVGYIIPMFIQESKLLTAILSVATGAIILVILKLVNIFKIEE